MGLATKGQGTLTFTLIAVDFTATPVLSSQFVRTDVTYVPQERFPPGSQVYEIVDPLISELPTHGAAEVPELTPGGHGKIVWVVPFGSVTE